MTNIPWFWLTCLPGPINCLSPRLSPRSKFGQMGTHEASLCLTRAMFWQTVCRCSLYLSGTYIWLQILCGPFIFKGVMIMYMGRCKNVLQQSYLNSMNIVCAVLISRLFRWKMVKWTCSFNARRIDTWKEQTRSWSSSDCVAQCWRHSLLPWGDYRSLKTCPSSTIFSGHLHYVLQKQIYFKYEETILFPLYRVMLLEMQFQVHRKMWNALSCQSIGLDGKQTIQVEGMLCL